MYPYALGLYLAALVASAFSVALPPPLSPLIVDDSEDIGGFPSPDALNLSQGRQVTIDVTIDLGGPLDDSELLDEYPLESASCSNALLAAGVAVLLAALVALLVFSLYLKRQSMRLSEIVPVKHTSPGHAK